MALSGHRRSQLGYRPPAPEIIVLSVSFQIYATLQPVRTLANERRVLA